MAENASELHFGISTSSDNSGLVAHTAAVRDDTRAVQEQSKAMDESRTIGARNLASQPSLRPPNEPPVSNLINSEKEYLQAVKLYESYSKLAYAKKLIGVEDEALVAKIAAIDAALSSESALLVAEKIEQDALAAAKAKATAAAEAEAIASVEESAAHRVNTAAMREEMVILHELMQGRYSRIPGSLSILAGQGGGWTEKLGLTAGGIMAVSVAGIAAAEAWEHWYKNEKLVNEAMEETGRHTTVFNESAKTVKEVNEKSADSAARLAQELKHIAEAAQTATEKLRLMNQANEEAIHLQTTLNSVREAARLAINSTEPDPMKRAKEEFEIKQKAEQKERADQDAADRKKSDAAKKAADDAKSASEAEPTKVDAAAKAAHDADMASALNKTRISDANRQIADSQREQDRKEKAIRATGISSEQMDWIRDMAKAGHSADEISDMLKPDIYNPKTGKHTPRGPAELQPPSKFNPWFESTRDVLKANLEGPHGYVGQIQTEDKANKSLDESNKRDEDLRSKAASADAAYAEETANAKRLAEESKKLGEAFAELKTQLDSESAQRNEQGRLQTVQDLNQLLHSSEAEAKRIWTEVKKGEDHGRPMTADESKRLADVTATINDTKAKIKAMETEPETQETWKPKITAGGSNPKNPSFGERNYDPANPFNDRSTDTGGFASGGVFDPESQALFRNIDYAINTGQNKTAVRLLAAFEKKHKEDEDLLRAIILELNNQGQKHAQLQRQVQSNT